MKTVSKKKNFFQGVAIVLFFSMFVFVTPRAQAGAWGEALYATLLDQTITTIKRQIEGAVLGTLKVTAIELLNTQIGQLVGGTTSKEGLIITDYDDFLYKTSDEKADIIVNDLFKDVFGRKGSSAVYIATEGSSGGSIKPNFAQILEDSAKEVISTKDCDLPKYDLSGDPKKAIQEGDWRMFSELAGGGSAMNNIYGSSILINRCAESVRLAELEKQKIIAQSSGFKPATDADGNIITAAGTVEGMVTDVKTLGNKIIAAAENPGELLSGVITSVVNKTITNVIQQGTGKIQNSIRREIRSVDRQISNEVRGLQQTIGPAAEFLDETNQRIPSKADRSTPAPASSAGAYGVEGSEGIY